MHECIDRKVVLTSKFWIIGIGTDGKKENNAKRMTTADFFFFNVFF